ncbi:hypothetical protein AMECASPLE_000078 [Ameca splendens]|uniref:Uncharacterized protein n=1 Tax=Ameca splendens TaxID=208324 RepID=A0ABV0ZTJ7_9TELE
MTSSGIFGDLETLTLKAYIVFALLNKVLPRCSQEMLSPPGPDSKCLHSQNWIEIEQDASESVSSQPAVVSNYKGRKWKRADQYFPSINATTRLSIHTRNQIQTGTGYIKCHEYLIMSSYSDQHYNSSLTNCSIVKSQGIQVKMAIFSYAGRIKLLCLIRVFIL